MYDWEIENCLRDNNYSLSSKVYIDICKNSPQIKHVKYNAFENYFEIWTDCNYFKFSVYPESK